MADNIIEKNRIEIKKIMQQYSVVKAYAFGSAVNNAEFNDVDFVVKFDGQLDFNSYYNNYVGLIDTLEKLLHKPIDLVAEETLKNPYLIKNIQAHKMDIL
jgi:uncharacterized protein